jgi:hypothetical protein
MKTLTKFSQFGMKRILFPLLLEVLSLIFKSGIIIWLEKKKSKFLKVFFKFYVFFFNEMDITKLIIYLHFLFVLPPSPKIIVLPIQIYIYILIKSLKYEVIPYSSKIS